MTYFRIIALLTLSTALLAGCAQLPEPVARTATPSLDQIVARTLEAIARERALTPENTVLEEAPGEEFSVEVTQEAPLETPVEETAPALPEAAAAEDVQLPESHYIWDIWGHRQYFPIGCEASAATDWAWYFGVDVNEFNFQMELPVSDNPDLGFVGSVEGPWGQVPPYAYGVHAAPVAQVLRDNYGMPAQAAKGFTIEEIQREIASGQPVIAWVIGNCVGGIPYEYIDEQGNSVIVAAYEHVVIITGYNEDGLRYMNNGKFYDIQYEYFENTWSVLGNMVVYLADE
ncbi:MAG: hypothetical protein PWQ55_1948 [Chloroflexota bacterium]|nr:hypothetical protein [Chloroflexota bacterium]